METLTRKTTKALHRIEKGLYKELVAIFQTMQRLDRAGCSAETYLEMAAQYRIVSDEHFAVCDELRRRYDGPQNDPPPAAPSGAVPVTVVPFPVNRLPLAA